MTLPLVWLFQACSPLGEPVDKTISNSHYYTKDKKDVIYSPGGNWFERGSEEIGIEDIASLEILNSSLCKDRNKAYFKYKPINDVEIDVNSLRTAPDSWNMNNSYAMDKNKVYYFYSTGGYDNEKSIIIEGANPEHFTVVDYGWGYNWGKDGKNHFYDNKKIDADYASFQILSETFGKDKNKGFCYNYQFLQEFEVDIATFEEVGKEYARDKNNIYHFARFNTNNESLNKLYTIPYLNYKEVTTWDYGYVCVASKVYYFGAEITLADASSFQTIDYFGYAKDKNHVYYSGGIIKDADPDTFTWDQNNRCFKDKNHNYEDGAIL